MMAFSQKHKRELKTSVALCASLGAVLAAGLSLTACADDSKVAGASTLETENAYLVKVVTGDSLPVVNVAAKIRPSWFVQSPETVNPSTETGDGNETHDGVMELRTDEDGYIRIDSLTSETAFLEISSEGEGAFREVKREKVGTTVVETIVLQKQGSISGSVTLPAGEAFAWVQIYGTDRLVKTDSTGAFTVDSLPPSEYQVRAILSESESAIGEGAIKVSQGAETKAGTLAVPSTENEDLSRWAHSRTLPLGSLISEWMKPIADTTVVFLRLNSANFEFSEAMANGEDLRFTDMQGNRLPSDVAAWDDSLENANVRIRINGAANTDSVVVYWGKTAAANVSSKDIWKGLPDSLYRELNSLKLIDFESRKLESALEYEKGFRQWYFEPQDSNVTTTPSKENVSEGFEEADGRGYIFHWKSQSKVSGKWSMIGSMISQKPANFEGLDSITIDAKGHGLMAFALETLQEPTGKTKFETYLDSNWTHINFSPDKFVEGDGKFGNMGWDFVKPRTTTATVWIVDDSEIWIDEITLYGINRDDVN